MMHYYTSCRAGAMYRIGYTQMYRRGSVVYGAGANGGYEDYLICPAYTGVHRETMDAADAACLTPAAWARYALLGTKRVVVRGQEEQRNA